MKKPIRLIVGANDRQVEGYIHHDVLPLPGIDIVCEFWDLPKHVEAGSCEEIQVTHVLEHFPMKRTVEVLELLYDLLQDGGELYVEVPNFHWHAEMILQNPRDRQIVEYAFGGQVDQWDFHYNGFTPEILEEDLIMAGFSVDELLPESSIICWASK